jgi:hypothetical protein
MLHSSGEISTLKTEREVGEKHGYRSLIETRDKIKMYLRYTDWDGIEWMDLANTVMNLWILQIIEKFLSGCSTSDFSKRIQLHRVSYGEKT